MDLGEPGDGAGVVTRRGGACHAGEARAKAAIASRMAARSQSRAAGQAAGSSNASNILTERLKNHDPGTYAKIISQAEVNTSAMTEAQVLAYGRQALVTHTQRPP